MSASTSRAARWARAVVTDWTALVTRGLPDAADRRAEIASDLWEQSSAADRAGRSGAALAAALLGRAARGAVADLGRRRRHAATAKPWVPLTDLDVRPFDQTSGALADLDTAAARDDGSLEARLLAQGVASNSASTGFGGASF